MQHAGGPPLPPPGRRAVPGRAGAARQAANEPPTVPLGLRLLQGGLPPVGADCAVDAATAHEPGLGSPVSEPMAPVPPAHPPVPAAAPAPQGAVPAASVPPPASQLPPPPSPEVTGHIRLPSGAPVAMPSAPPPTETADATATTLAVLLIGPAGAGKTSVAKYWAERRRVPTAHISLDDVREWVRAGFADPQSGWNDNSEAQYRLARRTCGFAARNFLANGISCILDDAVFPDRPVIGLGGWKRHVGPGLLPVVLLPGLEIVLERNAQRSGNRRLSDEEVASIHGRMAGWYGSGLPIIDNSQLDVPATAQVLDEVLGRAIASPPQW
ncbi:AAA family ATPase [Streptomyces sp. NA04227]|uniref:AAA family ATPase n=1 Tax=Streptomyces sp. NA04227 TaxID=2742136 RepID=UPI001592320A|nr:AAA family ATPase [Streptomyces sp. NA04227]QKW05491.1 AAA family ATPase [Streptomyces sp. NA04227]